MRNQLEINKEFGKNPTFSKANIFEEKETIEDDAMYENSKQGRSSTSRQHALPKRATEILTRWFNNHIHHPYPTEADKEELSRKTNLKVHQISNWFVNMRARKWKKAIETTERTNTTSKGTLCRGNLPKAAVRKLKVWLFENFENPYPNDKQKLELAKSCNLSLTQVNNWFINARRRIWKPIMNDLKNQSGKRKSTSRLTEEFFEYKRRKENNMMIDDDNNNSAEPLVHTTPVIQPKMKTVEPELPTQDLETIAQQVEILRRENEGLRAEFEKLSQAYVTLFNELVNSNDKMREQIQYYENEHERLRYYNLELSRELLSKKEDYKILNLGADDSAFKFVKKC